MVTIQALRQVIATYRDLNPGKQLVRRDTDINAFPRCVFTGVRVAGKSTLMIQKMRELISGGTPPDQVVYIPFNDERLLGFDYLDFDKILQAHAEMNPEAGRPWLFLDEIQEIEGWENFARRLADTGYKAFITGSNARMLSSDIATKLGARYVNIHVFTFSLREFLRSRDIPCDPSVTDNTLACARIRGACREWLSNGGFPEVVLSGGFPNAYLNGIYQQIYEGDIIARNGFENKFALRLLLKKTAEGVGRPLSFSRLQGIVSSAGARIGKATVIRYMESACEAFLLYPIRNFADKLVARETNPKYFFADNGILKLLARDPASAQFENAIALALLRRYGTDERVFFYEDDRGTDVDFYIPEEETAIQACLRLDASDATSTRETAALLKLGNRLDCRRLLILTLEEERTIEDKGRKIEVMPLWKWLLGL